MVVDGSGGYNHLSQEEGGFQGMVTSSISPSEFSLNGLEQQEGNQQNRYELGT